MIVLRRAALWALAVFGAVASGQTASLKQIMSDPEWVARSPTGAFWAWDGGSVLFDRRREGSRLSDRWRVDLDGGEPVRIEDGELPFITARGAVLSADRTRRVFSRSGDIFVRETAMGVLTQVTRSTDWESRPLFMVDGSIAFERGGGWFVRSAATGIEVEVADIRVEEDPADAEDEDDKGYLAAQQERLFEIVRQRAAREEEREAQDRARKEADRTRVAGPFYLGKEWRILRRELSPSGAWMLLVVAKKNGEEKQDVMPAYVNDDGYVSTSPVRPKVGEEARADERMVVLDLAAGAVHWVDPAGLPLIADDPLAWLKDRGDAPAPAGDRADPARLEPEAGEPETPGGETPPPEPGDPDNPAKEKEADAPGPRPFGVERASWSPDGSMIAVQLRSNDNKDRWIAVIEPANDASGLRAVHHLRDEAWINWAFNEMGWLRDGSGLWFLSEHTGFGHLYLWDRSSGETRELSEGGFTVQDVAEGPEGGMLYYRSNRRHPGAYEIERVDSRTGAAEPITALGGTVEEFEVSPDGSRVLFRYSTAMDPPELMVQAAEIGAWPKKLTSTVSDLFRSFEWIEPSFVEVPSNHTDRPIHCRVYTDPATDAPTERGKPVVIFAHGAGYTQHVYNGWSYYFREHMFHTLLCRLGYIVIAPDFRASEGYGRDWRTAIYRRMGEPELEDFDDCLAWLDEHTDADTERVGIYGGSYGGFLSLMAMFLRPEVYDCGAALRPVTDWAHYNHGYTSNILNTPEIDPEAFEKSSPIEHAEGLAGALLMCHGMLDDNVVAQDTVRLAQRLIELEKENWEMALYPVEPHGFQEATGWLDEYRRILKLFETNLKD